MPNRSQVSVVIPCFNDGRFLPRCLKSVCSQTHTPLETIVVDDGSTDKRTVGVLRELRAPGLKVIHQENQGPAGARNTGIRKAQGKYIYFLDADNVLFPDCLGTLSSLLDETDGAIAAYSQMRVKGGPLNGSNWGEPYNPFSLLVYNQWDTGLMASREALERHDLFYDDSMRMGLEDWEFHMRLVKTGKPLIFYPRPLYEYLVRKQSVQRMAETRRAEIIRYIRNKHKEVFSPDNLLALKRKHAPALSIAHVPEEQSTVRDWLDRQTFGDWVLADGQVGRTGAQAPYALIHAGADALQRLPPEALECALTFMESYPQFSNCLIAVRKGCLSLFAAGARIDSSEEQRQAIALLARNSSIGPDRTLSGILSKCESIIDFPDEKPESGAGWDKALVQVGDVSPPMRKGADALRKDISSLGKKLFGSGIHRLSVRFYDHVYYRLLCSDEMFALRRRIGNILGARAERYLSALTYGFFLTKPPVEENIVSQRTRSNAPKKGPPLFLGHSDQRVHILIATAWLTEGGVDQIVLDLCRLLPPARFRVTIATCLPSAHPWHTLARAAGASIYHLADFLRPSEMANGFLHLVLNKHVDCMFIIHSEAAYRTVRMIKRGAPWLPIVDRNEVLDPGGGFPLVTAKVGNGLIDLRTVSHRRLAAYMHEHYGLALSSLSVIYIGANLKRIDQVLAQKRGLLHERCSVSPESPIVLFVGRFAAQKRPEVFVRSVAKILEQQPDCQAHFAMIGDGDLMPSVKTLISRYHLEERIQLLGAQANAIEFLADAALLMMPSAYEGLALVSYEAMALGVPQIFANVGGQEELITPETGVLIDNGPGEETRYAQACLELLADRARRERMAAAGKERIRTRFTVENAINTYAAIFAEMAELGRKRAAEIPHLRPPHLDPLHEIA